MTCGESAAKLTIGITTMTSTKSLRRQDGARSPDGGGARKNPRARRRHGHDDPAAQILRRRFSRATRFADWPRDLRGNNDLLILTQPDAIRDIHLAYFQAGADIVETNTFSCTTIAQADYGMESLARELNVEGARLAVEAAIEAEKRDGKKRFVAGAMGPTNRTASISPDVSNPGFRAVTFDELRVAYQAKPRAA